MKKAFTLAEVLITLGVIGVVAALTMPSLISNIQDKVFETQRKAAASKLSQAITLMHAQGNLERTNSLDAFVENLKSYLKIVKVCEKSDLDTCFTDKVSGRSILNNRQDGESLMGDTDMPMELSSNNILLPPAYAASGLKINRGDSENNENTNNVIEISNLNFHSIYDTMHGTNNFKGIVTNDGVGILIGYAQGCTTPIRNEDVADEMVKYTSELRFNILDSILGISPAYAGISRAADDAAGLATSENIKNKYPDSTIMPIAKDERACVVALIDVNVAKKPNEIGKDVFFFQSY